MAAQTLSNEERFLRLREVLDMTGLSRSSLYAMVSEGKFPEPVAISGRSKAWLLWFAQLALCLNNMKGILK